MTDKGNAVETPMNRFRNYWVFSAAIAVVWAIAITLHTVIGGGSTLRDTLLIFSGFTIGWVATTIARYVYPPARLWQDYYRRER